MARELADEGDIDEIDARDCTLDKVREIADHLKLAHRCLFRASKAWIINEADDLRADVLARLKTALEPKGGIPNSCAIIFTCTKESAKLLWDDSEDAPQFLGRCLLVKLGKINHDTAANYIHGIADKERLNGKPDAFWKRLAMDCRGDLRMMLTKTDAGIALEADDKGEA